MARRRLKPSLGLSLLGLFLAILASLYLMSTATQNASHLGPMYSWLLLINSLASILLLGLVGANVYSLLRQIQKRKAGSSLTARMVILFTLLTLAPASVVFYFSMQFVQQSIDSWFDVRIDQAMEDALKLGQAALDERMRAVLNETEELALRLIDIPESLLSVRLEEIRDSTQDGELTVFSKQGRIIALSGGQSGSIIPDLPEIGVILQVKQGKSYVGLEPYSTERRQIRVLVAMTGDDPLYLQAIYTVPVRLTQLAETVEAAYLHYKEMTFLRSSLKFTFSLTLSLVLLLSLLASIWAAFLSIRRIVAPVRYLAQGTQAVAAGNYEKRLRVKSRDELGFLVESFNAMTERIAQARDEAHLSRQEVERQRAYLATILANLSSAVLSLDADRRILTVNQAADAILHIHPESCVGLTVETLGLNYPHLHDLIERLTRRLAQETGVWQ
ncbi:MAG: HAMP domain-containing protein, partial [Methylococcaceae bacterium]